MSINFVLLNISNFRISYFCVIGKIAKIYMNFYFISFFTENQLEKGSP